mmetsp:Transcript_38454/g.110430  ORF Transcript_38454/g.110430 Transcript_38454/m.110430 type:complete len:247 (-) Transcript_38454:926-1666(-)
MPRREPGWKITPTAHDIGKDAAAVWQCGLRRATCPTAPGRCRASAPAGDGCPMHLPAHAPGTPLGVLLPPKAVLITRRRQAPMRGDYRSGHGRRPAAEGGGDVVRHVAGLRLALDARVHEGEPAGLTAPVVAAVAVEDGGGQPSLSLLRRYAGDPPRLLLRSSQGPRAISYAVVQGHVPRKVRVTKDVQIRLQLIHALPKKLAAHDLRQVRVEQEALLRHELVARQEMRERDHGVLALTGGVSEVV